MKQRPLLLCTLVLFFLSKMVFAEDYIEMHKDLFYNPAELPPIPEEEPVEEPPEQEITVVVQEEEEVYYPVERTPSIITFGIKIGMSISGMFADKGLIQLPQFADGSYYRVAEMNTSAYPHFAYDIYSYFTLYPTIQLQLELLVTTFKGMNYDLRVELVDSQGNVQSGDIQSNFISSKGEAFVELMYFELPVLFRYQPDFYSWYDISYLDFYFLFGPGFHFLESSIQSPDFAASLTNNNVEPTSYFKERVLEYDISLIIGIGYILEDMLDIVDPIFEFRVDFGLLDINRLSITGTNQDSTVRNWSVYLLAGFDFEFF